MKTLSAALLALVVAVVASPAHADEVLEWNVAAFAVAEAGGQNPIMQSRTLAMVQFAVHDALNAIDRRFEPYLFEGRAAPTAHPGSAVAAASRGVLVGTLPAFGTPEQRARAVELLDRTYAAALSRVTDGPERAEGIAAGEAAARAMLEARARDGARAAPAYTPGTAPGQWRPTPNPAPADPPMPTAALAVGNLPAMLPQWATLTPFSMATPWQFRLPGPPALDSERYARDYAEVKLKGGKAGAARSADETQAARYWYEGSPQGWSRIARVVSGQRGLDRWESARVLALVSAVMADGFVAGADTRYLYNFWRPVTAIRAGDADGNDATPADPTWESLLNTPAMPDYPSTHSVLGAAAAAVLARVFGSDQIAFTMTSGAPFAGITRSFPSFSAAALENASSRVYAGLHFRSACDDGLHLGAQIGRRGWALYLQPYRP